MKPSMLKATLLALSLVTVMSGAAVAPAIAQISAAFPAASQTAIKLVLTLPAVFIIAFSLISGRLSSKMRKRSILSTGLFLYLVGGIGGGFAQRFEELLLARAVLGIGVGLIMPLSTGLIADFFDGDERVRLIGYSTAAQNLGGIIATITSGMLAVMSWRYSFGVYGFGLIVWALVLGYLPEPAAPNRTSPHGVKLPRPVYAWAVGAFVLMIAFYAIPVNMAIFVQGNHFGDASMSGIAISIVTAFGFLAGLCYGRIKTLLKSFLPAILIGLMTVGYTVLSQAQSLLQVFIATGVIGLGFGWAMPTLITGATQAGGKGEGIQVMAIVSSMIFLGQFLSPIVLDSISGLLGHSDVRFTFTIIAFAFGGLLLVTLTHLGLSYRTRARTSHKM